MADVNSALSIGGSSAAAFSTSAANASGPLTGGVYAVWANPINAYIAVTKPGAALSTAISLSGSSNGMPVIGGAAPVLLNVPNNGQICAASTAAGAILGYQKVG